MFYLNKKLKVFRFHVEVKGDLIHYVANDITKK